MVSCNGTGDKNDATQAAEESGFDTPPMVSQNPSTWPLSPEESLRTFRLPKGFHLELVASAAVRMTEPYLNKNDILSALHNMTSDKSKEVLGQLMLSLSVSTLKDSDLLSQRIVDQNKNSELLNGIQQSIQKNNEAKRYGFKLMSLKEADRKLVKEGAIIFKTL